MITIGCDLKFNLKLYHLPDAELIRLQKKFPNCDFQIVNVEDHPQFLPEMQIYWGNRINADIIKNSPQLKWIHFGSLGVNNARSPLVNERNIIVTNSRGTVEKSVALTGLAFLLNLVRGIEKGQEISREGEFSRASFDNYYDALSDFENFKTLIVGYGEIGKILANFLRALGSKIEVVVKNSNDRQEIGVDKVHSINELGSAVSCADAVVNLLPFTDETKNIFGKNIFESMKNNSYFINIGRGETVVETELIDALKNKKIKGAGLDVFSVEPLADKSPLHQLKNVLLTPHVAAISPAYWNREVKIFEDNLTRFLRDEQLLNVVDMTKGY